MAQADRTRNGLRALARTDAQRRMLFALTDDWRSARELAEVAGIPLSRAGSTLLALHEHGHAERRDGGNFRLEWRRALDELGEQ